MRNIRKLLPVATILLLSCGKKENKTIVSAVEEVIPVSTSPVKQIDHASTFQYSGMMASATEIKPSFKIGGIIAKIYVKEGDKVSRGQLLASLDLTEINAQIEQSEKGIEKIKRDMLRIKNLFKDTAATLEQVQNIQTQLDLANENLHIAQFNKQFAQIKASENGTIIHKLMNEGELASSGSPVFLITGNNANDWVVRFGVSDKDWAALKPGDPASIYIEAYPDKPFKGNISKMAAAADPNSNTYEIEVKVLPGKERFAAGLFSKIELYPAKKQRVALLPIEAITEGDGKQAYVYTINNDGRTVKKHRVQIAFIEQENVGVTSGIDGYEDVITGGVGYLTENAIIKKIDKKN